MFDIHEYYNEKHTLFASLEQNNQLDGELFEHALEDDITKLLTLPKQFGFSTTRYKKRQHSILLYAPELYCPFGREYMQSPDYLRFLLSVYPDAEDLRSIENIVFRPRFVETAHVQLVSLYLPVQKTIVLYLAYPHVYTQDESFFKSQEFDLDLTTITNPHYLGKKTGEENLLPLPPLFYIIKTLGGKTDNSIDKFLLKIDNSYDSSRLALLGEISHYFNRHGY